MIGAIVNLNHPGRYIHWGWFQMSLANLIVILVMGLSFLVVMRVDTLRATYTTFAGQVVLVIVGAMVIGILALLQWMTPRTPWIRWDVAAVREQMRRRYA